jgi:hypothetical protein
MKQTQIHRASATVANKEIPDSRILPGNRQQTCDGAKTAEKRPMRAAILSDKPHTLDSFAILNDADTWEALDTNLRRERARVKAVDEPPEERKKSKIIL